MLIFFHPNWPWAVQRNFLALQITFGQIATDKNSVNWYTCWVIQSWLFVHVELKICSSMQPIETSLMLYLLISGKQNLFIAKLGWDLPSPYQRKSRKMLNILVNISSRVTWELPSSIKQTKCTFSSKKPLTVCMQVKNNSCQISSLKKSSFFMATTYFFCYLRFKSYSCLSLGLDIIIGLNHKLDIFTV